MLGLLKKLANEFLWLFDQDAYPVFPNLTLPGLCDVSVKGGLGIENLRAQERQPPPNTLVWENYMGDCDLNLLIKKSSYPAGEMSGEVMARVAKRTKILIVQAMQNIPFDTAADEIEHTHLQDPLYFCSQVEALAHVVTFASRDLHLGVDLPAAVQNSIANLETILNMIKTIQPQLAGICGRDFDVVCKIITGSKSNRWLVYNSPEKNLLFITDLERIESTWTDVDYSFFPYAPGRVDSQGYEISELAMRQMLARQRGDLKNPYDIFTLATSNFVYTDRESVIPPPDERDDQLHKANPKQNLSMYANNLIDDFALLRSALRFHGYALRCKADNDYTVNVSTGTAKCEYLDVAIPRIGSPEWFYCQDRAYYQKVPPAPPPQGQMQFKICNWEYQVEENLNLLIELGIGLSHSTQKAGKRISRFCETWEECNMTNVFPRQAGGPLPAKVPAPFQAPAVIVANWVSDYTRLYSIGALPDWLYNEIFFALFVLHQSAATYEIHAQNRVDRVQLEQDETCVKNSAKVLGGIGLVQIPIKANQEDIDAVAMLRTLLNEGYIKVNWVVATFLLLKQSQLPGAIWFPRFGIFQVVDHEQINIVVATDNNAPLADNDYVMVTWDNGPMGPPLSYFTLPAADAQDPGSSVPNPLYSGSLEDCRRSIYRDIRMRLMRANNQMLRIAYGGILNALYRSDSDTFLSDTFG